MFKVIRSDRYGVDEAYGFLDLVMENAMSEDFRMDRSKVEISSLKDQGSDTLINDATPAELMAMVWQLTLDAWTFKDPTVAEHQFQRHVVSIVRGGR